MMQLAVMLIREAKKGMPQLAHKLAADESVQPAKGIYGVSMINRGVEQFGFDVLPMPKGLFDTSTRFYLKLLLRVLNPAGKQRLADQSHPLEPRIIAMSMEHFWQRPAAGRKMNLQPREGNRPSIMTEACMETGTTFRPYIRQFKCRQGVYSLAAFLRPRINPNSRRRIQIAILTFLGKMMVERYLHDEGIQANMMRFHKINDPCDDAAMYMFDGLSDDGRKAFDAHLEQCPGCRQFVADIRSVHEQLGAVDNCREYPASGVKPWVTAHLMQRGRSEE